MKVLECTQTRICSVMHWGVAMGCVCSTYEAVWREGNLREGERGGVVGCSIGDEEGLYEKAS